MIAAPRGWTVRSTDGALLLAPPGGAEHAMFRYVERRRPIVRPLDALLEADGVPAGFEPSGPGVVRRLSTSEHEQALLVVRPGRLDNRAVELAFGYVLLDDYYASLTGIAYREHELMRAWVEQLIVGDVHLLGWRRRRRFAYAPPAGWTDHGDLFAARWRPAGAPSDAEAIFVNPALPLERGLPHAILDKLVGGIGRLPHLATPPVERVITRRGLVGDRYRLRLRRDGVETHAFFLVDADFLYTVRANGAGRLARALVETIEPVPRPRAAAADALRFWAE